MVISLVCADTTTAINITVPNIAARNATAILLFSHIAIFVFLSSSIDPKT
jgi:hypothetical protein